LHGVFSSVGFKLTSFPRAFAVLVADGVTRALNR
jgi:hypothetical protein